MSAYAFPDGINNFAIYVKIFNAIYLTFAIFFLMPKFFSEIGNGILISNSNDMTYFNGIRIIIFWHIKVIPGPKGTAHNQGDFCSTFFQNEDFFWRQIFLKSTDHSTVGESENDHLACTPKRQWILSGRSDQKPNPPKNELD